MKQNITIKSLIQENKELTQRLIDIKNQETELKLSLLEIHSTKAFKLWGILIKLCTFSFFLIRICFALFYFLFFLLFFLVVKIIGLFLIPFRKELLLSPKQTVLDGVSFIIPTWNQKQMVTKCVILLDHILSLEKNNLPKEIIIIDNGSIDHTYQKLIKLKTDTKLIILKQKTNLGFALGVNKGVEKASYNYVYLLNNDMEPQADFFENLINYAQQLIIKNKPFFGITSQVFFFDKTKRREESGKTYIQYSDGFITVAHVVDKLLLSFPSVTAYCGGGSSLINKHLFGFLGNFDHKTYVPMYCEDLDSGFNAWRLGYPSYFLPSSKLLHHHQSSSKNLPQKPDYYINKNFLAFLLKNINSTSLIVDHLVLYSLKVISSPKYFSYALDNIKNIHHVFKSRIKLSIKNSKISDKKLLNSINFELENIDW